MSMREPEFQQKVALTALQRKFHKTAAHPVPPAAVNAELTAISTALASDPSLHDQTIETPPAALRIGHDQTSFTNDILHIVNKAKGGNLTKAAMISAIDGVAGVLAPPRRDRRPPSDRREAERLSPHLHPRQLDRHADEQGLPMEARVVDQCRHHSPTYTTVLADHGSGIGCIVTATNATGSTPAPLSNQIVVT